MVKRQTVWLSTMMVLSLMLIGYYTMNNGNPSANPDTSISTSTATQGQDNTSTSGGSKAVTATVATAQSAETAGDKIINAQMQVQDELAQREAMDMKIMTNTNESNDATQTATQDWKQATQLNAGISNAISAVEAQGYTNAAIVPTANGESAVIYVQAKSLTNLKAAEILDVVSQNTGISAENLHVQVQS